MNSLFSYFFLQNASIIFKQKLEISKYINTTFKINLQRLLIRLFNSELLFIPLDSIQRTIILLLQPIIDAVHMEIMATLSLQYRAIVSCEFTFRTRLFKWFLTNCALSICYVPAPTCNCNPFIYFHFHFYFFI